MISIFLSSHDKEFIWKARGFQSVDEMNAEIVKRWNEVVTPDDEAYVLGDLCMGINIEKNKELIESLNGKLHILLGNHDTDRRWEMYKICSNVVELCGYATILKYKKFHFYLSHYPCLCANTNDGKTLRECIPNLCGHTHASDPFTDWDKGRIFHCEVDSNNCYPWNIDNVIEKMKEKLITQC